MSDNKRGLPVRTQEDPDLKLQTKLVDFVDPSLGMEIDSDKNGVLLTPRLVQLLID